MSVVAAAVGPAGAAAYGAQQLCGRRARKRKEVVVQDQETAEVEISRQRSGDDLFLAAGQRPLFVLDEEEEEEERSSIGAASEEEGDEADSPAVASTKQDALAYMDALDDALPIKRGLSSFFSGKSRSLASLQNAAVTSARDLAKPENPFNKRRRVLRCSSIRRVASTALLPFLPLAENNSSDGSG